VGESGGARRDAIDLAPRPPSMDATWEDRSDAWAMGGLRPPATSAVDAETALRFARRTRCERAPGVRAGHFAAADAEQTLPLESRWWSARSGCPGRSHALVGRAFPHPSPSVFAPPACALISQIAAGNGLVCIQIIAFKIRRRFITTATPPRLVAMAGDRGEEAMPSPSERENQRRPSGATRDARVTLALQRSYCTHFDWRVGARSCLVHAERPRRLPLGQLAARRKRRSCRLDRSITLAGGAYGSWRERSFGTLALHLDEKVSGGVLACGGVPRSLCC
jgi:hypothetical protein